MTKGTIIYIGGFELPDKNAAAHRVMGNAKIFRELGYNVVFVGTDKDLSYGNGIVKKGAQVQNFDSWYFPYPKSKRQWLEYLCHIKAFVKVATQYSDIKAVICYDYQAAAFIRIRQYCKKHNIKVYADCAEWYSSKGNGGMYRILKGLDTFVRMRILHKHLDGIIVISQYLKEYYKKCKNLVKIPPLVDSMEDKWKLTEARQERNKIRFVYAGSPGKNKDKINYIIECLYELKHISNYVFYVIGITEKQYLDYHTEHTKLLETLHDRVIFIGRLPHEDTLNQIKGADFSIFLREDNRVSKAGFPTKFVESLQCKTPVITTNTSDLGKFLVENKNGFFIKMDSAETIKTTLCKILSLNREQILIMKKSCYDSNLFDYRNYIASLKDFI